MCGSLFDFDFVSNSKFCIYEKKKQTNRTENCDFAWLTQKRCSTIKYVLFIYFSSAYVFFLYFFLSFLSSLSFFFDYSSVYSSSNLLLLILRFSTFAQFFSFTTRMNRFSYILFFAYTLIRHHWSYRLYLDAILLVIASIVIYRCQFCSSQHILLLLCILCTVCCEPLFSIETIIRFGFSHWSEIVI